MTERIEQRACIKFCQKLGHSCSETIHTIRQVRVLVYDDESMSDTQIKEWFKRFKSGRAESEQHQGCAHCFFFSTRKELFIADTLQKVGRHVCCLGSA
ncbi:PREDICTED: uncharacterized protein LOC105562530 isoform X2 [Vollenhovia emeryi]|uniref:uncharacterized protein LOC105562530 isoform X2 n=1 Tax=Vollenhovia emeryi TaxID=411798 RepID=UPI0005F403A2|nr:PREDICTED: uncharacterized protein LOC105562530 isoform X2 [Vollenhovia emeryi]